jgi:hypothetical protein
MGHGLLNLLGTAARSNWRSVYVPVWPNNGALSSADECVWTDGAVSLFLKAHQGGDGLVIDLRVVVDPPLPPAGTAALAASSASQHRN